MAIKCVAEWIDVDSDIRFWQTAYQNIHSQMATKHSTLERVHFVFGNLLLFLSIRSGEVENVGSLSATAADACWCVPPLHPHGKQRDEEKNRVMCVLV